MKDKPTGIRTVRCPQCLEYEYWKDRETLFIDKDKYGKNKYFHKDCLKEYKIHLKEGELFVEKKKAEQIKKEKDKTEQDYFFDFIKDLHDIPIIPTNFFFMIENIKNGTRKFHGTSGKSKNKPIKGFSYEVIHKAYVMSKKYIVHCIKTKNFKSKISELSYCLKVAENNLVDAQQKVLQDKRKEKIIELEEQRVVESTRKVEYKKKGYENDIYDLFE
jgi:hypothetical protein